jgi:hypothetical protein
MAASRNEAWLSLDSGAVIARRDRFYTNEQIADALDHAQALGFDLSCDSPLADVTVAELMMLVEEGPRH